MASFIFQSPPSPQVKSRSESPGLRLTRSPAPGHGGGGDDVGEGEGLALPIQRSPTAAQQFAGVGAAATDMGQHYRRANLANAGRKANA